MAFVKSIFSCIIERQQSLATILEAAPVCPKPNWCVRAVPLKQNSIEHRQSGSARSTIVPTYQDFRWLAVDRDDFRF